MAIGMSGIFFAMADNAFGEYSFAVSSVQVRPASPYARGHRQQKTPPGLTGSLVRRGL
jgi:hypothetical protein